MTPRSVKTLDISEKCIKNSIFSIFFNFFTEFSALSSSETEEGKRFKPAQRKQLNSNVNGTERNQQKKYIAGDLQLQLQNKQKELEAAQAMVQLLRKREKNLTDR